MTDGARVDAIGPEAVGAAAASLELEIDARVHYALSQCDVPVVKRLALSNDGATELREIVLEVELGDGLAEPCVLRLDALGPGRTFSFDGVDLRLSAETLRTRTERSRSALSVRARAQGIELARRELPIEVFAIDEWPGLRSLPALLATFVMPNHPAVGGLL
ncbi:MAG: hypothetical protein IT457_07100, partial [Planctomycetes bacterium]|nr:hypothetical protein [Planctomycetota bacterium]